MFACLTTSQGSRSLGVFLIEGYVVWDFDVWIIVFGLVV